MSVEAPPSTRITKSSVPEGVKEYCQQTKKLLGGSRVSKNFDKKYYVVMLTITKRATITCASLSRPFRFPASLFLVPVGLALVLVAVGIAVNWLEYSAAIAVLLTSQGAMTHSDVRVLSVHFPFEALEGVIERT